MDTRTQAIINELAFQRNQAQDAVASLSGEMAVLREQLEALKPKEEAGADKP